MKKIALYIAAVGAMLGMASCSQDRDPVLQTPTEFVLNVPAMQNQYLELQEGDVLELVCSQPNYGYSAVANYSAEVSLTEDFANYETIIPADNHQARMSLKQADVATALCMLHGVDSEDSFAAKFPNGMQPEKVYFRAVCQLDGVEGSLIKSNVVSYNEIKGYFAVPVAGYIYLVGAPEGWAGPTESNADHYADWRLYEPADAIGSHVYSGVFDIPAGSAMFRFYTQLTGWDADSYGSQEADEALDFDFDGDTFTSPVVKGKGSFNFPNWEGGKMTIVVDMSDMKNITMTCTAGEASVVITKYIYLMGSLNGWVAPAEENADKFANYRLADKTGDGIYTGSFDIPAGTDWYCRFAPALGEDPNTAWDVEQWGANANDGDNTDGDFSLNAYTSPYVSGKGCWHFNVTDACTVAITVDTNNNTVEFVTE